MAAASTGEWAARMQKRRDFELTMLRRPSETQSLTSSTHSSTLTGTGTAPTTTSSPTSPSSLHSAKTSMHSFDQLQALQLQLQRNSAQIEANEARMRELEAGDVRVGADLEQRLRTVGAVNAELSFLRGMLERVERVSRGEFGVGVDGE